MLLNPYQVVLKTLPGSRVLQESLGLLGAVITDPSEARRSWTITNVYSPIEGRMLGGIRVKLEDNKGFTSFCNQRDLELLLGLAKPGDYCPWLDEDYPELDEDKFFGICADTDDLCDDLLDREFLLRAEEPGVLPHGLELTRRVYLGGSQFYEELDLMLWDCDPETGLGPDPRLETIMSRWTRVERNKLIWSRV